MDGVVDKADADLVLEYVAELKELTPGQLRLADMNGDGRVMALDASLILQKAAAANPTPVRTP
jgi:hypothetical protein